MAHRTATTSLIATLFLAAPAAAAQPIGFTVDESQSSITFEIEIVSPIGTRTDSDTAATGGTATVQFDDNANPTTLTLIDYTFVATETFDLFYDYGPLGTLTVQGIGVGITLPDGFPAEFAFINQTTGAFTLTDIDTQVIGTVNLTSTGTLAGTVGDQTYDLAVDTKPDSFLSNGTVTVNGSDITIVLDVPFQTTQEDDLGLIFNIGGTASVVLTNTPPCPADLNGNGVADPGDFTAWVAAYNMGDPAADQNGNGAIEPGDFTAWVANYNAGC
ncbi:MAG: GC-type dockerin domain-anchored protein [Phycisphaerales bacterium]